MNKRKQQLFLIVRHFKITQTTASLMFQVSMESVPFARESSVRLMECESCFLSREWSRGLITGLHENDGSGARVNQTVSEDHGEKLTEMDAIPVCGKFFKP